MVCNLNFSPSTEAQSYLSSHFIWTQPGLRRKDQGWYHFSTALILEHNTSSHRCSTCSLTHTHTHTDEESMLHTCIMGKEMKRNEILKQQGDLL